MNRLLYIFILSLFAFIPAGASASEAEEGGSGVDAKEIIFEHLGDGYGWEVPFNHHVRIPLPVIVNGSDGWHVFSSAHLQHGEPYTDGSATFVIGGEDSDYKGKVVEIVNGQEVRPFDISITKNVCALFITVALVFGLMMWLASFYRRNGMKAPRRGLGAIEALLTFVYDGVIKSILGPDGRRFAPYLLTVFFLIFFMNILGLIVVFPGGANLTGNVAVTLTLATLTFLVTNVLATKHYWLEMFWPDVPVWLKFPLFPIMQLIEVFGMFTKPAALTVRLFANMMGGHMIVLVLTLLIFIFSGLFGAGVGAGTTVISMAFSIFMLLLDCLVSFIQAYVFTMLFTIFISLAQVHGHHEPEAAH